MTTRLILRLMDADGQLLGWQEVQALARGDGALWLESGQSVTVPIDVSGSASVLSVHWPDVHVEARQAIGPVSVTAPGPLVLPFTGPVFRVGTPPVYLPGVTVRSSRVVAVPVGVMSQLG